MDWDGLKRHHAAQGDLRIGALLADPARAADFSVRADGLLFDYSKTTIDAVARAGLLALAEAAGLAARREAMFSGDRINQTEGRAVLHTALRDPGPDPVVVDGQDVLPGVHETLDRMAGFATALRKQPRR